MKIMSSTDKISRRETASSYQIDRHIHNTNVVKELINEFFTNTKDLEPTVIEKLNELKEMRITTLIDCRLAGEKILDLVNHPEARFNLIYIRVFNLTIMELLFLGFSFTLSYYLIS